MAQQLDSDYRRRLANMFSYRAEWLDEKIFTLFSEPSYFPQLTTSYPCFLIGGRGTGKTTALRCLSYQGQAALTHNDQRKVSGWPYYGMYYRVNTNRVGAFRGPEPRGTTWTRAFAHYLNVEFCELVLDFLHWYEMEGDIRIGFSPTSLERVAAALHLDAPGSLDDLRNRLGLAKLKFEAAVNNSGRGQAAGIDAARRADRCVDGRSKGSPRLREEALLFSRGRV